MLRGWLEVDQLRRPRAEVIARERAVLDVRRQPVAQLDRHVGKLEVAWIDVPAPAGIDAGDSPDDPAIRDRRCFFSGKEPARDRHLFRIDDLDAVLLVADLEGGDHGKAGRRRG